MSTDRAFQGLRRALGAEVVRARRTVVSRLVLGGLAISGLQGLGWAFLSVRELTAWQQLLAWQSLYLTGLYVPFAALVGALSARREAQAREGGTAWRAAAPGSVQAARTMVTAGHLLVFDLAVTLPTLGWGLLGGLAHPPVARLVGLALLSWALSLPALVFGFVVTRWFGMVAAVLGALVWQVAGTIRAEQPSWWFEPWTWQVRPVLPVLGIHQNGVALEPGSPVWTYPWWPAVLLSLAAAGALQLLTGVTMPRLRLGGRRTGPQARPAAGDTVVPLTRTRPRPVLAMAGSLRRTAVPWLVTATALGLVPVMLLWDGDAVRGLVGHLILPLGCCLLAVLAWQSQTDAWRGLATRRQTATLAVSLLIVCAAVVVALCVVACVLVGMGGGAHPVTAGVVGAASGVAGLVCCLWLTARHGAGAALGVTLVLLVLGAVFGGFFADTPLWVLGVTSWMASATTPGRALLAVCLSALTIAVATPAWLATARRRAW